MHLDYSDKIVERKSGTWTWEHWATGQVIARRDELGRFAVGHRSFPPKWCAHIGDAHLGKKNALGYRHTEEARKRIGDGHHGVPETAAVCAKRLGRSVSEETRAKMLGNQYALGHSVSEEVRKKMSEANLGKKYVGSASRFHGVYRELGRRKYWKASVWFHGKMYFAGSFVDEIEAAKAADRKAVELWGDKAVLNFTNAERDAIACEC